MCDLTAFYILDELAYTYINDTIYTRIFRDDGKQVWKGIRSAEELSNWLDWFQEKVNLLLKSEKLKFEITIWKPPEEDDDEREKTEKRKYDSGNEESDEERRLKRRKLELD